MTDGDWALTLKADEIPGGDRALPFTRTWNLTLQAGRATEITGRRPPSGGGGPAGGVGAIPLVLGGTGAAGVILVSGTWLKRRRRQALVPVR